MYYCYRIHFPSHSTDKLPEPVDLFASIANQGKSRNRKDNVNSDNDYTACHPLLDSSLLLSSSEEHSKHHLRQRKRKSCNNKVGTLPNIIAESNNLSYIKDKQNPLVDVIAPDPFQFINHELLLSSLHEW